jgi:hypothetical protein
MPPPTTIRPDGTKPCTKCGSVLPLSGFYTTGKKRDGSPKYNSWCRDCSRLKMASYHQQTWGPERLQFSAHKRTQSVRAFMSYLLAKARRRRDCQITADDLEAIWASQGGRCALTGWEMTMRLGEGQVPTNASIDRIDSRLGYSAENVQLVCRAANVAKSDLPQQEFVRLCAAVVEKQREQEQDARLAA